MKIFSYATITNFGKSEFHFDEIECVFNFWAYGRFSVINMSFPVYCVVWNFRKTFGSACNAKIYFAEICIFFDFFTLFNSYISWITVYDFIIFSYKIMGFRYIMNIGWCCSYCMNIVCSCVCTDMTFHSETPLVAFLGLVHLWL